MDPRFLCDVVLVVLALEAVGLHVACRRSSRLPRFATWIPTLAAGVFLVLALRTAIGLAGTVTIVDLSTIGALLALAGVAHVGDLVQRVRSSRAATAPAID